MIDDILLHKAQTIERCIKRVHEEYQNNIQILQTNFTKQDSIILNIQRACEAAIDMAVRIVKLKHLQLPQTSREIFVILEQQTVIPSDMSKKLQTMVGFRNIAVHDYINLNLDIVKAVIENNLTDLLNFSKLILSLSE